MKTITPVQEREGIFFKRDDLFQPLRVPVNGGKLRQAISHIISLNTRVIVSASSVLSPQAIIIPAVCYELGIECHMVFGGTDFKSLIKNYQYPQMAYKLGATFHMERTGRHNVTYAAAERIAKKLGGKVIHYEMNAESNQKAFFDTNALQVQNIPQNVDHLIVTCGSGITAAGIIKGISTYKKKVEKVHLIGVGPNRLKKIEGYIRDWKIESPELLYHDLFDRGKCCLVNWCKQ